MAEGTSSFARGTIPFAALYLGLYFPYRTERMTFKERGLQAVGAATAATLAELPFDASKLQMTKSRTMALTVSLLRIPLASMLLLAYDQFSPSNKNRRSH